MFQYLEPGSLDQVVSPATFGIADIRELEYWSTGVLGLIQTEMYKSCFKQYNDTII
jgi:hypothetical protein